MRLLQGDTHRKIILVLVVVAVCAIGAAADQLTLKDGEVLQVTVLAEIGERYYVKVVRDGKSIARFVDKANVAKITRGKTGPQVSTTPTTPPAPIAQGEAVEVKINVDLQINYRSYACDPNDDSGRTTAYRRKLEDKRGTLERHIRRAAEYTLSTLGFSIVTPPRPQHMLGSLPVYGRGRDEPHCLLRTVDPSEVTGPVAQLTINVTGKGWRAKPKSNKTSRNARYRHYSSVTMKVRFQRADLSSERSRSGRNDYVPTGAISTGWYLKTGNVSAATPAYYWAVTDAKPIPLIAEAIAGCLPESRADVLACAIPLESVRMGSIGFRSEELAQLLEWIDGEPAKHPKAVRMLIERAMNELSKRKIPGEHRTHRWRLPAPEPKQPRFPNSPGWGAMGGRPTGSGKPKQPRMGGIWRGMVINWLRYIEGPYIDTLVKLGPGVIPIAEKELYQGNGSAWASAVLVSVIDRIRPIPRSTLQEWADNPEHKLHLHGKWLLEESAPPPGSPSRPAPSQVRD